MTELKGIIHATRPISQAQAEELQARFTQWANGSQSRALVLGDGVYFRQMREDGTLEPMPALAYQETRPLTQHISSALERDWSGPVALLVAFAALVLSIAR